MPQAKNNESLTLKSTIKKFIIEGLFEHTRVELQFNDNGLCLLVGENGIGKTTILNILYYAIKCDYSKLVDCNFKKFSIVFHDDESASLSKKEIERYSWSKIKYSRHSESEWRSHVLSNFNDAELNLIAKSFKDKFFDPAKYKDLFKKRGLSSLPPSVILEVLNQYIESDSRAVENYEKKISNHLNGVDILYFPTYRRIEAELQQLCPKDERIQNSGNQSFGLPHSELIQFGMGDVKDKLKYYQTQIQKISTIGLSQISGEIISQLVRGGPDFNKMDLKRINVNSMEIVLSRMGSALKSEDKQVILDTIKTPIKTIDENKKFLMYFIKKLINIYDQQCFFDEKIKQFINVCNRYLKFSSKEITYDESSIEFYIKINHSSEPKLLIDFLGCMSSGEKQILSIFSKIFLSDAKQFIVLFDEPELSLSMEWQYILLPDILSCKKISNMLAVTHSPFVFDNELVSEAKSVMEFMREEEK